MNNATGTSSSVGNVAISIGASIVSPIFFTLVFVENLVVIIVAAVTKTLRNDPHCVIILNISISDAMVGLMTMVLTCTVLLPDIFEDLSVCCSTYIALFAAYYASSLQILLVCVERIVGMRHPHKFKKWFSLKRNTYYICVTWMLAIICSAIPFIFWLDTSYTGRCVFYNMFYIYEYSVGYLAGSTLLIYTVTMAAFFYLKWQLKKVHTNISIKNDQKGRQADAIEIAPEQQGNSAAAQTLPRTHASVENISMTNRASGSRTECSGGIYVGDLKVEDIGEPPIGWKPNALGSNAFLKEENPMSKETGAVQNIVKTDEVKTCRGILAARGGNSIDGALVRNSHVDDGEKSRPSHIDRNIHNYSNGRSSGSEATRVLTIIIIALTLTVPIGIISNLIATFGPDEQWALSPQGRRIRVLLVNITSLNSGINPLIYAYGLKKFRHALRDIIRKLWGRSNWVQPI